MFSSALIFLSLIVISKCLFMQQPESRIVNGEEVEPGEIPYQISLQKSYIPYNSHFCGGSLVSLFYIVTAAHCVENLISGDVYVIAGTTNLSMPRYIREIKEIIIHEEYTPSDSYRNDIALLKLLVALMPSSNIGYARLPKQNENFGEKHLALVSGFGRVSKNGPISVELLKATISLASQEYCRQMYTKIHNKIYDSHICAFNSKRSTGACNGDSGGPLIVDGKLVGIVSWSLDCSRTDFPTVFTRVSSYVNWIEKHFTHFLSRRSIN